MIDVWQGVIPNVTVPASSLSANVTNLHPAFTYHVRVRANNTVGIGTPSAQVTAVMDEERPSGPPQDIKIKAIGSEALEIKWMVRILELVNNIKYLPIVVKIIVYLIR